MSRHIVAQDPRSVRSGRRSDNDPQRRSGRIPGDALQPKPGWPELFGSYDAMDRAQADSVEKGHT